MRTEMMLFMFVFLKPLYMALLSNMQKVARRINWEWRRMEINIRCLITILRKRCFKQCAKKLRGIKVIDFQCIGKPVLFCFDNGKNSG